MTRRVPVLATIVVLAAVATMIALGVWQLHRKEWKEALIARYQRAQEMSSEVPWPIDSSENEAAAYRHSGFDCARVIATSAIAGRSATGRSGWAHQARCALAGGGEATVALGWSENPASVRWRGGQVYGFVAPAGDGVRLIAAPPQAGLAQLAPPDPRDIANNHLAYAWQWFFFAATALAIYALALRKRWRGD
jgi:surfeit locus 1 family protein